MNISETYDWLMRSHAHLIWVIQVFVVVLLTAFAHFFASAFLRKLAKRLEATKTIWDDVCIKAIQRPVGFMIWLMGLSFAFHIVEIRAENPAFFAWIEPGRKVGMILLIAWAIFRFVKEAELAVVSRSPYGKQVDRHTAEAVGRIIRIAILITMSLVILQALGIPVSGVLAFGGAGTVIIGFASKDLLSNFFGGLMIYLDRPFKVGDWIRSPDRNIEGTVEAIGWRLSRIRTFDKRPLYIPNSVFATICVENPSRMTNRRIKTLVGLRYDDARKLAPIVDDITKMLKLHEDIDNNCTCFVNLVNFGPSSLDLLVYTFTKTTDWVTFQAVQQDVFLKILEIVDGHGAEVAFPTKTLHIPDGLLVNQEAQ